MNTITKICRAHLPEDPKKDYAIEGLLRKLCDEYDAMKAERDALAQSLKEAISILDTTRRYDPNFVDKLKARHPEVLK